MSEQNEALAALLQRAFDAVGITLPVFLERPKDPSHGDFACNAAMQSAKALKRPPRAIAQAIVEAIEADPRKGEVIQSVEIAGPGFINFRLARGTLSGLVSQILAQGSAFGTLEAGSKGKILLEYVSANPTGPLHLGHARQGALGDVLAAIYAARGYDVTREFYYNDAGVQIDTLTESVLARARELIGQTVEFPENGYKGDYIVEVARDFLDKKSVVTRGGETVAACGDIGNVQNLRAFAVAYLQNEQDADLRSLGIAFDSFYLESSLYSDGLVEQAVSDCVKSGLTYEKDGALWLKTTDFEGIADDKDRVMRKSDGHYTYFVPDVAYHVRKFTRGFTHAIDIQGSDHHGTTSRVRIGVQVVSRVRNLNIPCPYPHYILHKMLKVVRDGQEVKMSKRAGTYVTLRDLVGWVGRDAARYFLVSRKADTEFVFDVNLALSRTEDNPVYYLQYAHARISSVFRQAEQKGLPTAESELLGADLSLLDSDKAGALMARLAQYPETLENCVRDETPHLLCNYLKDLAADFHAYYNGERVLGEDATLTRSRLALLLAVRTVLRNGFALLGIDAPERM